MHNIITNGGDFVEDHDIAIITIMYAGGINLASGKPVETDQDKDKEKMGEIAGEPITWPSCSYSVASHVILIIKVVYMGL